MRGIDKVILGSVITASVVSINYNISSADKIEQATYITTNRLNMRKGPGTSYAKVGTLNQGQKVIPIEKSSDGKWVKIKYNSQEVWVSFDYLKKEETQSTTSTIKLNSNYKTTGNLNMRKGPATSYDRITTLPLGTVVTPTSVSSDKNWVQVKYNNQTGWISVNYIKLDETSTPVQPENPSDKPGGQEETTAKKYKTTGNLNMRTGPATTYDRIATLPLGTVVTPMKFSSDGKWAQVKYNNQIGWISVDYIKLDETSTPVKPEDPSDKPSEKTQKFSGKYITSANLTLRKGSGKSYQAISTIPQGTKVEATEITLDENWMKVTYNGQTGWVNSDYLNEADTIDEEDANPDYELPNNALGDDFYTTSALYFRVNASSNSSLICQIPKNTKVVLLKFNSDASWAQVIYNNKTGWVLAQYLNDEPLGAVKPKENPSEDTGTYREGTTKENLNLRKGPSTSYSVLVTIPKNSTVKVYSEQNGWAKIKYKSYEGYCSALYIK